MHAGPLAREPAELPLGRGAPSAEGLEAERDEVHRRTVLGVPVLPTLAGLGVGHGSGRPLGDPMAMPALDGMRHGDVRISRWCAGCVDDAEVGDDSAITAELDNVLLGKYIMRAGLPVNPGPHIAEVMVPANPQGSTTSMAVIRAVIERLSTHAPR